MPTEPPPCEGYARIQAEAQQALSEIERLTGAQRIEDLQMGLEEIKQHLIEIASDNHSS